VERLAVALDEDHSSQVAAATPIGPSPDDSSDTSSTLDDEDTLTLEQELQQDELLDEIIDSDDDGMSTSSSSDSEDTESPSFTDSDDEVAPEKSPRDPPAQTKFDNALTQEQSAFMCQPITWKTASRRADSTQIPLQHIQAIALLLCAVKWCNNRGKISIKMQTSELQQRLRHCSTVAALVERVQEVVLGPAELRTAWSAFAPCEIELFKTFQGFHKISALLPAALCGNLMGIACNSFASDAVSSGPSKCCGYISPSIPTTPRDKRTRHITRIGFKQRGHLILDSANKVRGLFLFDTSGQNQQVLGFKSAVCCPLRPGQKYCDNCQQLRDLLEKAAYREETRATSRRYRPRINMMIRNWRAWCEEQTRKKQGVAESGRMDPRPCSSRARAVGISRFVAALQKTQARAEKAQTRNVA
jgi:hypothetical protein